MVMPTAFAVVEKRFDCFDRRLFHHRDHRRRGQNRGQRRVQVAGEVGDGDDL
jgi:hypothetical protein